MNIDRELVEAVQIGIDQADRGEVESVTAAQILAEIIAEEESGPVSTITFA